MKYKTVQEMSAIWQISETKITYYCRNGKIDGSYKNGHTWMIPETAVSPINTFDIPNKVLSLPTGTSNFIDMVTHYHYVDKTLMIKDIIDILPKISLFTRPRRFGKSLNMNMLKVFFEATQEDNSIYFKDKLIWSCGTYYTQYQGQYPVIYLSFKDVKFDTYTGAINKLKSLIREEYERHDYVLTNYDGLKYSEKEYFNQILQKSISDIDLMESLYQLSKILANYHHKPTIIIIDEYDTPIHQGYLHNYYDSIISFMRNLFSEAFKDNSYLAFGFLTGILRIAKESIFSGMNNLIEYSILNEQFSQYFGFTKQEIKSLLKYYHQTPKYKEICEWYDGYNFGNKEIFNPWSIVNYLASNCKIDTYWQATGSNEILKELLMHSSTQIHSLLQTLLLGETITVMIDTSVIYPNIRKNDYTIFSFLLISGYLKIANPITSSLLNSDYELKIPNKEIATIFSHEILDYLTTTPLNSVTSIIRNAIKKRDVFLLKQTLQAFLKETISLYDTGAESFYQGLILGLYGALNDYYRITSNREAGDWRYDIALMPLDYQVNEPGIIIELKVLNNPSKNINEELIDLAQKALKQIDDKHYTDYFKQNGTNHILKYGIAFYKKNVEIVCNEEVNEKASD